MTAALDMTESIAPKSDQCNADDFMSGPRTFTIADVRAMQSDEQPFAYVLAEFPSSRPYKPSKTMRRVLVLAWGKDAREHIGHRLTLYRDPDVKFGGSKVGGIKISHMSHLQGGKAQSYSLTETRGKRTPHKVLPLDDAAPVAQSVSADTLAEMKATLIRKGIPEGDWLRGVNHAIGGGATDLEVITEDQARLVLDRLAQRPDADQPASDTSTASAASGPDDAGMTDADYAALNAEANAQTAEFEASRQSDGGLFDEGAQS